MTKPLKRKRRINKRKLRELRARDAEIERYADELRRAGVVETTIDEAVKALHVILTSKQTK